MIHLNSKILLLSLLSYFIFAQSVFAQSNPPLVEAEWLNNNLNSVVIIDIRDKQKKEVSKTVQIKPRKFIPGSLKSPYSVWRSKDKTNPGALISKALIQQNIRQLGLDQTKKIVIVFQGKDFTDFGSAARVYWTLKVAGLTNLSILNGGINSWIANNYQTTSLVADYPNPSNYQVVLNQSLIAKLDEVKNINVDQATLLDARIKTQYLGKTKHPAARTYGAIANSTSLPSKDFFGAKGAKLLNTNNLFQIAKQHNLNDDKPIYSYCNTGHWAATNWFVLSEVLAYDNVKMYPGSFVEYSQNSNNVVKNEPNIFVRSYRKIFNL